MKKIKLKLSVAHTVGLSNMLLFLFDSRRILEDMTLEYYVLADFYRRFSLRFMYPSDKPFQLQVSEAYALYVIMESVRWPIAGAGAVATAILWQLGPKFQTGEKIIKNLKY
jgi:hypothetical protein